MRTNSIVLPLLALSIMGCSPPGSRDTRTLATLAGCWEVTPLAGLNRPPSEWRLISWRPDSSLTQSMIYEIGPRSRLRTMDIDVTILKGRISFDGYTGSLNGNTDTMILSKRENGQESLWRFVRKKGADSLMNELRSYAGPEYLYNVPEIRGDGWDCTTMAAVGIDGERIVNLIEKIRHGKHGDIHSFLMVKDRKLVLEEYFADSGAKHGPLITRVFRDRIHHLASTTKSVTSLLVGIAIDRGLISTVEDPIYLYLPAYASLFTESKKRIRISHMLTMTPGYHWRQFRVSDERNDGMQMWRTDNVIQFVLQKPLEAEPGEKFNYTNGVPTVTGAILKNATRMEVCEFAEKYLFGPLGISAYLWTSYPDGSVETDGGLALRPRDLAKIGQLCLNGGEWSGQRVVSESWIRESTKERLRFGGSLRWGYGYHWTQAEWRVADRVVRSYFVPGDGSQILAVFPDLQLVIVVTAGNYGVDPKSDYYSLFEEFILPAILAGE